MNKIVIYKTHKIYRYRRFQSACASGSFLMMFHNREDEKKKEEVRAERQHKKKRGDWSVGSGGT